MKNTVGSAHLDLLRTVAAWQVCLHHLKNLFFVDYPIVQSKNLLVQAIYYFSRFGHQSVVIFFVMSGLFISSSVIKQNDEGKWSWANYLIARLSRLYIALVPALILGFGWDWLGIKLLGTANVYDGVTLSQTVVSHPVIERLDLVHFLGNLGFLQSFKVSPLGSNTPLWSLSYEFWYYILFPLMFLMIVKKGLTITRIIYAAAFVIVINFIGLTLSQNFLIWLFGVAVLYSFKEFKFPVKYRNVLTLFAIALLLVAIMFTLFIPSGSLYVADIIVGIAASVLIYALVQYDQLIDQNHIYPRTVHALANFSYSLYLLHVPFLVFLTAVFLKNERWQPDLLHLFYGMLLFVVIILYAYAISCFTEAKTHVLKNWMTNGFNLLTQKIKSIF